MKKLIILGAGESGIGAALLGKAKGYDVFVSEKGLIKEEYRAELLQENIPFEEGGHSESKILSADEIMKSPGIADQESIIQKAVAKDIPVISELELAYRHVNAQIITITGTNGKTTTTLLAHHLLKESGFNVGLAGNVGNSFARLAITDPHDYYVLEVSSFQLDNMYEFKADAAILLNITPDHLDRYNNDIRNYIKSKFRTLQNMKQDDCFIYFVDDKIIKEEVNKRIIIPQSKPVSLSARQTTGAYLENEMLVINSDNPWSIETSGLPLQGKHNYVNIMSAVLAALHVKAEPAKIKDALKTFTNAAHRMEPAGEINGVAFINDSKATNVDAVYYALESFKSPVIWIAGGTDKGNDYSQLMELTGKIKALICIGIDNRKIASAFRGVIKEIMETDNMDKAIEMAYGHADSGETILLSPACASFDLFKNYMDRGEQFKTGVKKLKDKITNH
jgi:UDP-N-acetylmuramoylalanine--D-glutamate ligase